MKDIREYYILGMPIETGFGKVRFLKYHEYAKHLQDLTLMSLNVLHIYYRYRDLDDGSNPQFTEEIEKIREQSLYNIVLGNELFLDAYYKIFELVLDQQDSEVVIETEDRIKAIFSDEQSFLSMRALVMDMNVMMEDEVSPNPEIQKAIERSKRVKQRSNEKQSFSDIASSIFIATGIPYEKIAELTVFQLYASYYRLNQFKAHDATVLYSTVAEKINVENWGKHINLFEKESHAIEHSKFKKNTGSVFED